MKGSQIALIVGGASILLIGLVFAAWIALGNRHDNVPLFEQSIPMDSSRLARELDAANIPYVAAAQDGRLLVPRGRVDEARKLLVSRGLGANERAGFELFDKSDYAMTGFAQGIQLRRALEGELARTISALEAVRFARVHLVLPDKTLFKQDQDAGKASVLIATAGNRALVAEETDGIQKIVASAVQELTSSDVTVHDETGRLLSRSASQDLQVSGVFDRRQKVELEITQKLTRVVQALFPGSNIAVEVVADLSNDQVSMTRTEKLPVTDGQGALIQERRSQTSRTNSNASSSQELAGVAAKILDKEAESNHERSYIYGELVENRARPAGQLQRLSVGVVLPKQPQSIGLSMLELRQLLVATAGLEEQRGDQISIAVSNAGVNRAETRPSLKLQLSPALREPQAQLTASLADQQDTSLTGASMWAALLAAAVFLLGLGFFTLNRRQSTAAPVSREQVLNELRELLVHEPKNAV